MRGKAMAKNGIKIAIFVLSLATILGVNGAATFAQGKTNRAENTSGELIGKLLLTGSSTMAPLMTEVGKRFQALHPRVRVEVQAGGSGRGIQDARLEKAEIGMVSRAMTDMENDLYGFPIARDGVGVILHKDNPVDALTEQEVVNIFTGKIANWKLVGGQDVLIVVVNPTVAYSSVEIFTHYFKIKYAEINAHQVVSDNSTRIEAVSEKPNAITYVSVGEAERKSLAGAPIKLLSVGGVAATSKNISSGDYPLSRPLTLVCKDLPKGLKKAFIEFSLSSQVADLIVAHDFVAYQD